MVAFLQSARAALRKKIVDLIHTRHPPPQRELMQRSSVTNFQVDTRSTQFNTGKDEDDKLSDLFVFNAFQDCDLDTISEIVWAENPAGHQATVDGDLVKTLQQPISGYSFVEPAPHLDGLDYVVDYAVNTNEEVRDGGEALLYDRSMVNKRFGKPVLQTIPEHSIVNSFADEEEEEEAESIFWLEGFDYVADFANFGDDGERGTPSDDEIAACNAIDDGSMDNSDAVDSSTESDDPALPTTPTSSFYNVPRASTDGLDARKHANVTVDLPIGTPSGAPVKPWTSEELEARKAKMEATIELIYERFAKICGAERAEEIRHRPVAPRNVSTQQYSASEVNKRCAEVLGRLRETRLRIENSIKERRELRELRELRQNLDPASDDDGEDNQQDFGHQGDAPEDAEEGHNDE
ncbi:uncharacterized protein LAESUDRAFT_728331 [Laetiporus sulphureus 93-53]|uniref:Uncharacterized protein n=1 Tax=Laetiporus sulphureus 93-53 TaxID=1314785 RepID=A0A165D4C2_9APHY|nr:uncharacterized protein LAESUDRAFT_728331 [Laetiporus sulphureus 93-53]KZT04133.1 hypothetical protein LAESUDRAFT_728331 [Laetiporus sulphureus 93-53]